MLIPAVGTPARLPFPTHSGTGYPRDHLKENLPACHLQAALLTGPGEGGQYRRQSDTRSPSADVGFEHSKEQTAAKCDREVAPEGLSWSLPQNRPAQPCVVAVLPRGWPPRADRRSATMPFRNVQVQHTDTLD